MKRVCLRCDRTTSTDNLYCQEVACPAELSPVLLSYGEWLGDIEIVRVVIVLRAAVLYEVNHQQRRVYLKVAHSGPEHTERLKREALFLARAKHPLLPRLLPAYANSTHEKDPYGRTMLGGQLLYFFLFEHTEGEPLRNLLVKNPQWWVNHVGWLTISLATAINFLHTSQIFHLGLCPEMILVHFDPAARAPQILLFDLGIVATPQILPTVWYPGHTLPAYTAPELVRQAPAHVRADYRTDVYGLGLILYEMLVGSPVYPFRLLQDEEVYRAVERNQCVEMTRSEDISTVAAIALQAVSPHIEQRHPNVAAFAKQLLASFGNVPQPKPSRWPSLHTLWILVATLLAIAFVLTFAVGWLQLNA